VVWDTRSGCSPESMQKVRNAPSDTDGLDSAERPSGDQSRVSSSGEEGLQPALLLRWTRPGRPVYHRTAGTPMCAVSRASGLNSSLTFSVYGTKRDQFTSTHRTILYHSCVRDPKRDSPIIFASRRTRVPRPASARSTIDVTTCVSARHSRSSCASSTSEPARRIRFRACAPACFNPNVLLVYGLADV